MMRLATPTSDAFSCSQCDADSFDNQITYKNDHHNILNYVICTIIYTNYMVLHVCLPTYMYLVNCGCICKKNMSTWCNCRTIKKTNDLVNKYCWSQTCQFPGKYGKFSLLQTIDFEDNFESTDFNKEFRAYVCLFDLGLAQSPILKASD